MGDTARTSWLTGRRAMVLGLLGTVTIALVLVVALGTIAWGSDLRADQRLLPGTAVAGVDVGGLAVAEAISTVDAVVADQLDRTVAITYDDRTWTTTARDLGATSDLQEVVEAAYERTVDASFLDLARLRFGPAGVRSAAVSLHVPEDGLAAFVADLADDVDRPATDAELGWGDGRTELTPAVTGLRVEHDRAATAIRDAIAADASTVALPVEERAPTFDTPEAMRVAGGVDAAVRGALDHEVTVTIEGTSRTVTPRELDATHNAADLLAARDTDPASVVLGLDEGRVHEVVDEVLAPHEVAARDAHLDWTPAGGFATTPGATGLAVDHQEAIAQLTEALQGGGDTVALELHTTRPDVTTDDLDEVLLVRQGERRVELYRGGSVVRSWDVAVGTSGYATPTGMFTIGAKRFEPTWVNSSPNGWGSDMPARIGPGPDNPLGLRALNWMDGARDTLIRFHGTANEDSIGRAASHGCVRMTNPDVIELYDLVDSGTVIVSVHF